MDMQGQNKGNVLLTELVIVVLFFSLIAVTIVQMFVMSHQRGKLNAYTQRALIAAQDWAEVISGQPDPGQALLAAGFEQSAIGLYQQTTEDGALRVEVRFPWETLTVAGRLIGGEIRVVYTKDVRDPDMVLASIPTGSYIPALSD